MDEQRFDSLTRSLATGKSRRNVLHGLLGGVAAGLFARSAQSAGAESPRPLRAVRALREPRPLRDPRQCRGGQAPNCNGGCCPDGYVCYQDIGCYAADEVPCGSGSCPSGSTCTSLGMCLPPGGIECGAGYCDGDHTCINGQGCLPPGGTACGSGYCVGGLVCLNGQCERACDAGTTRCGQDCVDVGSNPSHCGGCGVACASGQVCAGGVCSCPDETELCGGECVNPLTDLDHCGACDTPCQTTACMDAACVEGQCQRAPIPNCCTEDADCNDGNPCTVNLCNPETSTCGSVMVDEGESCPPDTNPCTYDICDGAGQCIHPPIEIERRIVCMRPEGLQGICLNGDCVVGGPGPDPDPDPCDASTCAATCCADDCVNLQTDPLNCGACGTACATDEHCVSGACMHEDECELMDWRQYPEWIGTFTRTYERDAQGDRQFDREQLVMRAEVRFRLEALPSAPMFYLVPSAGTCSLEYTRALEYPNDPTSSNSERQTASGTEEINVADPIDPWALLVGGDAYGNKIYSVRAGICTVPISVTGVFQHIPYSYESVYHAAFETFNGTRPLPACPGPITGGWEDHVERSGVMWRTAETWTVSPAG